MAKFEFNLKGGWWMLAEMLIAEMKCQNPEDYEEYCEHFSAYLERYISNPLLVKQDGRAIYGTTTR